MDGTLLRARDVESHARRVLGSDDLVAEHHPVGFGNENWKLRDDSGCRFVLKIGDAGSEAKWNSSHLAYELAAAADLPVPKLVHVGNIDNHLVRIFTWIDGYSASSLVAGSDRSTRFLQSVGEAVRSLHMIERNSFSSRLDGSAPAFPTWSAYITYRLSQIRERCLATRAVSLDLLDRVCAAATEFAATVDDSAEAVLCHRDLHPDNLIMNANGTLIGIIDWTRPKLGTGQATGSSSSSSCSVLIPTAGTCCSRPISKVTRSPTSGTSASDSSTSSRR